MNTYKLRFGIVLALAFVIGLLFSAVPGGSVNAATITVCPGGTCDHRHAMDIRNSMIMSCEQNGVEAHI